MSTSPENTLKILKESLFDHCDKGESGAVFITTTHKKSCQITIFKGQITAFSLGTLKGMDAVRELVNCGCAKASFDPRLGNMPLGDKAKIESSDTALTCLGYLNTMSLTPSSSTNDTNDEAETNIEMIDDNDNKKSVMNTVIKELKQKRDFKEILTTDIHLGRKQVDAVENQHATV